MSAHPPLPPKRLPRRPVSPVDLIVANSENDEFALRLKAGNSFVLWDQNAVMNADNAAVTPGAGMEGIASVTAIADTASCDVEVFVASA